MLNEKNRKWIFACVGFVALILGLLIYLLYRESTYVAKMFFVMVNLDFLRDIFLSFENDFLKYYFVDYLWALSLCCGLYTIYVPKFKTSVLLSTIVFAFGSVYELLQYFNTISGTGDIADVTLYLLAGITANIINLILIKKEEKQDEKNS